MWLDPVSWRPVAVGIADFFWVAAVISEFQMIPFPSVMPATWKAIYRPIIPYIHKCCIVSNG